MASGKETGIEFVAALGMTLAVTSSYSLNHHLGWAALHGCFGWFYVAYRAISGWAQS